MDWGISLDTEEEEYSNYLGEGVGISRNWGNSRFFPFYGWPYNFMAPVRHLAYADILQGFPGNMVKNLPAMQETRIHFLGQEDSWQREW